MDQPTLIKPSLVLEKDQLVPREVEALRGIAIAAVSAGVLHSLTVTEDGAVYSWGSGYRGRLGPGAPGARSRP